MATQDDKGNGVPPSNIHIGAATHKKGWLPWLLLALGIIAILFAVKRCSSNNESARIDAAPAALPGTAATPSAAGIQTAAVPAGTSAVAGYLGGTEALPRTFIFETLNFDTAKSDIRPADRTELDALAAAMKQYPNARMRIVGYADARGTAAANATLGKARADSVKAALVADGIEAARLETASGGENNPVDTNATPAGQAENRRTELIVLQR